jgi:hypothetical protein
VRRDDRRELRLVLPLTPGPPIERFISWNGHWVLETVFDDVLVDGVSLGRDAQAEHVFGWHLVAGRPMYFFERAGRYGLRHDGRDLPITYDEVVRGGCCELAAFNPELSPTATRFIARRGALWYVVTVR